MSQRQSDHSCIRHQPENMQPLLEVSHLRKEYKATVAVDDISFSVMPGVCLGLLGPNGAGKTTTIEIIEDIIEPTSGTIHYRGKPRTATFREEIGIQFQHTSLLNFLSVMETLHTFAQLFRDPENIDSLIETCELGTLLDRRNDKLSGGQAQRLMLALALINKPHLVFLDEPSTGLDPQARRNLWGIVDQIKDEGKTVIMTTHSMEEAEHLCDKVAIIDRGRIIAEGSPKELIATHCGVSSIFLPKTFDTGTFTELSLSWHEEKDTYRIESSDIHSVIGRLVSTGADLSGMNVSSANLEDVFLRLTGRQLRD